MSLDQKRYPMRERKPSGCQENLTISPQKIAKNEKTPTKRVLSTRNTNKSEEKSQKKSDKKEVGIAEKTPTKRVLSTRNTNKSEEKSQKKCDKKDVVVVESMLSLNRITNFDHRMATTSSQLSQASARSMTVNKTKSSRTSKLSLKKKGKTSAGSNKNTPPKNQPPITNFFQKSPSTPRSQSKIQPSMTNVFQKLPLTPRSQSKMQPSITNVLQKSPSTPRSQSKNQPSMTNVLQKSPLTLRSQSVLTQLPQTVQEIPSGKTTLKRKSQQDEAEVQVKIQKTPEKSKTQVKSKTPVKSDSKENICAKKLRKKKVKKTKNVPNQDRINESIAEMRREFADKQEDGVEKDLLSEQMEEMMPFIRSPIKFSTPRPYLNIKEEEVDLSAYEITADDPMYAQYLEDCKTLKAAFAEGLVSAVDGKLAKRMLDINLKYLEAVNSGKVTSHLYEAFQQDVDEGYKMKYTDGCIIFSGENLKLFVKHIGAHFNENDDEHMKKLNFYLKVMVPELVAKIVMSVFKISKKKAFLKMIEIGIHVTNVDNCF